jgi:hypothetical protein
VVTEMLVLPPSPLIDVDAYDVATQGGAETDTVSSTGGG